jgi:hypothetical protein
MSANDKAYLMICVNTQSLPLQIPSWAMRMVDVMQSVRIAIIELEQAASTITNCDDEERSKAERCVRLFAQFDMQHGTRMKEVATIFTMKRGEVTPEIAQSFGVDIAVLALQCSNITFRGAVLARVLEQSQEWKVGESIAFFTLSESSKGQTHLLDWGTQFILAPDTNCTA